MWGEVSNFTISTTNTLVAEAEKLLNFGKSEGGEIEKKKPKPGENRKEELNKKAAKGMKSMSAFFMVKKK